MMNCAEFEVLLADSLDGALEAPGRETERDAFAQHLASCPACAAMENDVRAALAFMDVAADPELPQPLIGKILHATNSGWELQLRGKGIRGWLNRKFAPVLKPRFVMGAMLTDFVRKPLPGDRKHRRLQALPDEFSPDLKTGKVSPRRSVTNQILGRSCFPERCIFLVHRESRHACT